MRKADSTSTRFWRSGEYIRLRHAFTRRQRLVVNVKPASPRSRFQRFVDAAPRFARELFLYSSPAILALAIGPFIFEQQRSLGKPILSIEYAFLQSVDELPAQEISQLVGEIIQDPLYLNYRSSHAGITDLRYFINPSMLSDPNVRTLLSNALVLSENYLDTAQRVALNTLKLVPNLSAPELRMRGVEVLDDVGSLDEDVIRNGLIDYYKNNVSAILILKEKMNDLRAIIRSVKKTIYLKLSIQNKGALDGLVRYLGTICYNGLAYKIERSLPPPTSDMANAVPTVVVNQTAESFSSGAVGKIEKDSMSEFWYEISKQPEAMKDLKMLSDKMKECLFKTNVMPDNSATMHDRTEMVRGFSVYGDTSNFISHEQIKGRGQITDLICSADKNLLVQLRDQNNETIESAVQCNE